PEWTPSYSNMHQHILDLLGKIQNNSYIETRLRLWKEHKEDVMNCDQDYLFIFTKSQDSSRDTSRYPSPVTTPKSLSALFKEQKLKIVQSQTDPLPIAAVVYPMPKSASA